ncbi:10283_t:CDS:2 [Diversispora eburnea]|uniref:10283_t:CDS:1 n=1 Tax=Diversispora eburnea TaxID=1213867 RepID=A0A9N9F953_9GLOM|nr:10283_t:CDS:2 [Diversispora eburnea]
MQQQNKLKYGLNLSSNSKSANLKRTSIFNEEDQSLDDSKTHKKNVNKQLSSNSISKSVQEQYDKALEEDPTVFAYDEIYDDMKSVGNKKKEENKNGVKKPKYVDDILKAAETRKRDYVRAQERKVQREREAEGNEFDDKETFVTSAYKKQQEELRKAEAEEKLRAGSKDMKAFYRNLLDQTSLEKTAVIEASRKKRTISEKDCSDDSINKQPETDKELAEQARASGKMVILNDDEQIVDKRQLLSAGLNIVKNKRSSSKSDDLSHDDSNKSNVKYNDDKYSSKGREEIRRQDRYSPRKNDEKAISDAKARYLARKKK